MKKLLVCLIALIVSCSTINNLTRNLVLETSNYQSKLDSISEVDNIKFPKLDDFQVNYYYSSDSSVYQEYLFYQFKDKKKYILSIGKGAKDSIYTIKYRIE